jgi:hypothetical protein
MNHYLSLMVLCFFSYVVSNESFVPVNSKRCVGNNCRINEYIEPTPKLKKIIKDLLKKSEKIKNILIYPEPDDKEDWESGEIPWEPQPAANETYSMNNTLTDSETHTISSYDLGMLFI